MEEAGVALLGFDAASNATENIRIALGMDAFMLARKKTRFTVSVQLPQSGWM